MKYDRVHKAFQLFKNNDIYLIKNYISFFIAWLIGVVSKILMTLVSSPN